MAALIMATGGLMTRATSSGALAITGTTDPTTSTDIVSVDTGTAVADSGVEAVAAAFTVAATVGAATAEVDTAAGTARLSACHDSGCGVFALRA
jgi:hypothetical protein